MKSSALRTSQMMAPRCAAAWTAAVSMIQDWGRAWVAGWTVAWARNAVSVRAGDAELKLALAGKAAALDPKWLQGLTPEKGRALPLARLEGTDPYTEDLDEKVQALQRQIQDAVAVETELARMAAAEARELNQAVFDARGELAEALDARLAEAAERYNALAQATAAAAVDLCALRELMIKVGAGNSNGVDIAVMLPRATPGEARAVAPFFAFADRGCAAALMRRSDEISHELAGVGFVL